MHVLPAWQAARGFDIFIERADLGFDRFKHLAHVTKHFVAETSADFSSINELLPARVEIPDKDRAETRARALWFGEPADHKLLPSRAFDLQPGTAARANVSAG